MNAEKKKKAAGGMHSLRRETAQRCLILFVIIFCCGIVILAAHGAAPFGVRSMYALDLANQYVPMYHRLANIHSFRELLYSWSGALGYNAWAEMAYYGDSVFVLFLRGLNDMQMMTAVDLICVIKPALAAVTCQLYFEYRFLIRHTLTAGERRETAGEYGLNGTEKHSACLLMGCSAAYAMCGWSYSFMMETIWTDILILLPLAVYGLVRLMDTGKGIFYAVMLALILAANFYIGYMVCIFLVLYFLNQIIAMKREKGRLKLFLSFVFWSLTAAALAAVILLPAAIALGKTIHVQDAPTAFKWYENAGFYLARMMPSQDAALWDSGVNISTGILAFMLIPLYFCCGKYPAREKAADAVLLAVFFLSMNCNVLDYIWHGLHMPRFLPGRWTFVFSLFVAELEGKAWTGLHLISRRGRITALFTGICLAVCGAVCSALSGTDVLWVYYVFLGISAAVVLGEGRRKERLREEGAAPDASGKLPRWLRYAAVLLAVMQIADAGLNYMIMVGSSNGEKLGYARADNYSEPIADIRSVAQKIRSEDKGWYRISMDPGAVDNLPDVVGYSGITYFSSMMNGNVYRWFSWLGLPYTTKEISVSAENSSPLFTGIHGIRYMGYFWGKKDTIIPLGELCEKTSSYRVYRDPCALAVSFGVSDDLLDIRPVESDPVEGLPNQNRLVSAMCGRDMELFHSQNMQIIQQKNMTVEQDQNEAQSPLLSGSWKIDRKKKKASLSWGFKAAGDGPVYVATSFSDGTLYAFINGEQSMSENMQYSKYRCIGSAKEGDDIALTFVPYKGQKGGDYQICAYQLDENTLREAFSSLGRTQLELQSFDDTDLSGTVTASRRQLMFTSIPEDGGWDVYVDGEKTETVMLCGALTGYYVPEGTHEIRFRYRVPGLAAGAAVSASAAALCIILYALRKRKSVTV